LTVKLPLDVFPAPSVAEQLTVVVPTGKLEPEGGEQVTGTAPASVALAAKVTDAVVAPLTSTVIGDGRSSAGKVVSWTTTLKLPLVVTRSRSVAEHVTVVVPRGKESPDE